MTWGGAGSWVDCAALTPAGHDRRVAPPPSLFGNLDICPERKRGEEQMHHIRKDLRDASMEANAKKSEERSALLD